MVKRRVLSKLKEKAPESNEELLVKTENKPLVEYKETLYSDNAKPKKEEHSYSNQIIYRDIYSIEKNVDNIHIASAKKPSNELDRVVDRLLAKKKK